MRVGRFKKMLLKFITKMQEIALEEGRVETYYMFTKLHFYVYFGKSLKKTALFDRFGNKYQKALDRHINMIMVKTKTPIMKQDTKRFYIRKISNIFYLSLIG